VKSVEEHVEILFDIGEPTNLPQPLSSVAGA
jgi:hypothetical protein